MGSGVLRSGAKTSLGTDKEVAVEEDEEEDEEDEAVAAEAGESKEADGCNVTGKDVVEEGGEA